MTTLRFGTTYLLNGHHVHIQPGARIRRISEYGNLDARVIRIHVAPSSPTYYGVDLQWDVKVDVLEKCPVVTSPEVAR